MIRWRFNLKRTPTMLNTLWFFLIIIHDTSLSSDVINTNTSVCRIKKKTGKKSGAPHRLVVRYFKLRQ